jgi:hypothetical protein
MAIATTKKKRKEEAYPWKTGTSSGHTTKLKQCILETFDIYGNATQLKVNKFAAVFRHGRKLSMFLFGRKKCRNYKYLMTYLMRIPKWGLPFLYLLYLKSDCEKEKNTTLKLSRVNKHYLNIHRMSPQFSNFIILK